MGYHLRAEAAAGPRAEGRATRGACTPRTGVGSGYRYYSPEVGRWINRDPIEEEGGIHIYSFLQNQPIFLVDSHGLMALSSGLLDDVIPRHAPRSDPIPVFPRLHRFILGHVFNPFHDDADIVKFRGAPELLREMNEIDGFRAEIDGTMRIQLAMRALSGHFNVSRQVVGVPFGPSWWLVNNLHTRVSYDCERLMVGIVGVSVPLCHRCRMSYVFYDDVRFNPSRGPDYGMDAWFPAVLQFTGMIDYRDSEHPLGQRQRLVGLSFSGGLPNLWRLPLSRVQWESESVSEIRHYR